MPSNGRLFLHGFGWRFESFKQKNKGCLRTGYYYRFDLRFLRMVWFAKLVRDCGNKGTDKMHSQLHKA